MKNLFLTAVLAMSTLVASAQFMVVTTYDGDQEERVLPKHVRPPNGREASSGRRCISCSSDSS